MLGVTAAVLLTFASSSASAAPADPVHRAAARQIPTVAVFEAPTPVEGTDGRHHLVYEVVVENDTAWNARIDLVQVRDSRRARAVASYGTRTIRRVMFNFRGAFGDTVARGETGVLLLDVRLRRPTPRSLSHRLRFTLRRRGEIRHRWLTTAATRVRRRAPVRLRSPLRGGDLAVLGCCGRPFGHRLGPMEIDGRRFLPQRYAIDVIQLGDGVRSFSGDPRRNESYLIFGDDVLAVGSGVVAATRDGMAENPPPGAPPDPTLETAAGNYVNLDLGRGRHALYAHLQTGSVQVRPGDRVRAGQVLGRVGNTGNSTEPHLHFHVMDRPGGMSGLEANGRPYVFDSFRLDGRVTGLDRTPPAPARGPAPGPRERRDLYPLTGDIIGFP
jgi:hypothetical protein